MEFSVKFSKSMETNGQKLNQCMFEALWVDNMIQKKQNICLYFAELYQKIVTQFFSLFLKLSPHTEKVMTGYSEKTKEKKKIKFYS